MKVIRRLYSFVLFSTSSINETITSDIKPDVVVIEGACADVFFASHVGFPPTTDGV